MPVGVVDVGSNTVRLQVTQAGRTVLTKREMLRLGADVETTGRVSDAKLQLTAEVVAGYARDAGAAQLEILITSPGRQATNGERLLEALRRAGDCRARILTAEEEGRLGFVGALAVAAPPGGRTVAVVDVGGGSAQVVVGTRRDGPRWSRSIDLGSQRLTSRMAFGDPPSLAALTAARAEVDAALGVFDAPTVRAAYAVGGSARALKRLAGAKLDASELAGLATLLSDTPGAVLCERYDVDPARARTLAGGAVIVAAIQHRLGVPLRVTRGGVREGALLELAAAERAAA